MRKKKSPGGNGNGSGSSKSRRRIRNNVRGDPDRVTELLKLCLQKVVQLQEDMTRTVDEEDEDPEAAGYAACVAETVRFLSSQGLPPDHPVVTALTERLMQKRD